MAEKNSSSELSALLACPFCGGVSTGYEEIGDDDGNIFWYRVWCRHCTAKAQMGGTKAAAAENWNERAS